MSLVSFCNDPLPLFCGAAPMHVPYVVGTALNLLHPHLGNTIILYFLQKFGKVIFR